MRRMKRETFELRDEVEKHPVPIVSDAAVATRGLADGRLIPLLILDTSARPDIEDMIRSHRHAGPGDVRSAWAKPSRFDWRTLRLVLSATKPSRCVILIDFDVVRRDGVVDQIVNAQGLYLQTGRPGDRLVTTQDRERILIEVPSREFRGEWSRIFRKALLKDFMRRGLSRGKARAATEAFLRDWRKFGSVRMQ